MHNDDATNCTKRPYSRPKLSRFGQVRQLTAGGSGLTNESKSGAIKNARP